MSGSPCLPIRIALVEDDAEQRRYVREEIAAHPELLVVGVFESGTDAVARLAKTRPTVALVDIGLPDLSGIDVVQRCKPSLPDVQFMMLTVIEDAAKVYAALAAGATGYLLKKDIHARLYDAVRELRDGASPMSGSIARQVVAAFQQFGAPTGSKGDAPSEHEPPARALTERERQILNLLATGRLYKEIADTLGIALGTVHTHIRRIYEKLHARNRTEAIRIGAKWG